MNERTNPARRDALDVARDYHQAWTRGDLDAAAGHVAADLATDVPLATYVDAAEFLAGLTRFVQLVDNVELLAELGSSDEAILLYDIHMSPLGTLRVAEHFTVSNDRITRIRHVHDTYALREAGLGS
jgi:ketosteroid isomerase-like protein